MEDAEAGTDYLFSVDGGKAVADPRSRWQPEGPHGPSRVVGADFQWTDTKWNPPPLASGILYEVHIGTFTTEGTFRAAIERLDALVGLGVSHIEMMPLAEFPGPWGWGYDGVDLFAPYHHYGTPYDLKALVDACHERGLAVILDVVYNHFGPDGNYLAMFGRYTTPHYKTPWGDAVNLDDGESEAVREFFVENAVMWLRDYHFDGLRLDAVHALIDRSAVHLLEQLSQRVKALEAETGRHMTLIAESDLNDPKIVRAWQVGGYGIDAQWADDFHHALHTVLTGENAGYYEDFGELDQLGKAFASPYVYDGGYSLHRKRPHGRPPEGIPGYRFVACTQNHDQIGNRAAGDRLIHLAGPRKAKMAAALLMTAPYVPLLFQGEEWGASTPFQYFSQHEDADLGRRVSEGRRKEFAAFGWRPEDVPDPQDRATFERSKLNWDEREQGEHAEMLDWYRRLIALRRSTPDLVNGDLDDVHVRYDAAENWLVLRRGKLIAACNFGADRCYVPEVAGELVLASDGGLQAEHGGVWIPAETVVMLAASRSEPAEAEPRGSTMLDSSRPAA